jgi:hypothetical protein
MGKRIGTAYRLPTVQRIVYVHLRCVGGVMKKKLPLLSTIMLDALRETFPAMTDSTRFEAIARCIAIVYTHTHGKSAPWDVRGLKVKECEQQARVAVVIDDNAQEEVLKFTFKTKGAKPIRNSPDGKRALTTAIEWLTIAHRNLSGVLSLLDRLGFDENEVGAIIASQIGIQESKRYLQSVLKTTEKGGKDKP